MDTTIEPTSDDAVTIAEALKRLEKQAPARQSFYAAVNKGKIREVTDKDREPDGKRMVSWQSVQDYIAAGGFKQSRKSEAATGSDVEANSVASGKEATPSKADPAPAADTTAIPAKPRRSGNPTKPVKQKPASSQNRSTADVEANSGKNINSRGRRTAPLRVIKQSLRHLDYEQTKAIRDWADNRLLTVLRPLLTVGGAAQEPNTPA